MRRTDRCGDPALVANLHKRVLRAVLAVCAFSGYLAGYRATPGWIFALSAASVYFMTSAIIGTGVVGAVATLCGRREREQPSVELNIGVWDRVVRGALALAMMGGVMGGITVMLDTVDYFILMLITFYAGTTAIIAWDPLYALLRLETGPDPIAPRAAERDTSRVINMPSRRSRPPSRPSARSRAA